MKNWWKLFGGVFLLVMASAACSATVEESPPAETSEIETPAEVVASSTAPPLPTAVPTNSPESTPTATQLPTAVPATDTPSAPTPMPEPVIPVGSTASWTATDDITGIEGEIEFLSATQLVIRDFVFLAAEAPGVDIRLGVGNDFSDEVSVSLRDITGKTYEGRSLTLMIPAMAFDGRTFDSIGVVCYDNGDVFDSAPIETGSG
ncbi:hypothetical protein [Candidatus Leptofilum sp.]|uniref:hypothetical protein n=1 Tax=Candidatus Leptofilum sp. TaxID=3241576 RepID=UPI003B59EC5A